LTIVTVLFFSKRDSFILPMALKQNPLTRWAPRAQTTTGKKKNKEAENWNNMAYLMVMMQAFFLFLCFLLLEE
jgi:hypothetical protein